MPAKAGRAKADAGKFKRPQKPNSAPKKEAERPKIPAIDPLYSTLEQPRPDGAWFDEKAADHAVSWIEQLRHFKGRWAGRRFLLMDWQRDLVRDIFGWKREDGTRLYRLVYVEAPRKSGKTSLAAAVALYLAHADGESAPEIYFAAYDKDQAAICFDTARFILEQDADLHAQTVIYNSKREMKLRNNPGGFMRVLSKEVGKLYGINLHGAIFDELMTQKNRELWDALTTSEGSREQSLIFCISTAGWERHSVCFEQHELTRQIAEGSVEDESFLGIVYGAALEADWTDEEVWKAANPSLGETASLDYYRRKFTKAKNAPTEQNAFRTLLLSQWVGQAERFIEMQAWDVCGDDQTTEGAAFGGLDLSATTDLTGFTVLVGGRDIYAWAFLPEDGIAERERQDRVPYRTWAKEGLLTLIPGPVIDYEYVKRAVFEAAERFDLRDVSYDRWNSSQVVKDLEDEGIEMLQLGQGFASMSSPMKETQRLIVEGKLRHGGNPLLRWCASNLAAKMDAAGNVKPDKERSAHRIDPIVALVMAVDGWQRRGREIHRPSRYSDPNATLAVA